MNLEPLGDFGFTSGDSDVSSSEEDFLESLLEGRDGISFSALRLDVPKERLPGAEITALPAFHPQSTPSSVLPSSPQGHQLPPAASPGRGKIRKTRKTWRDRTPPSSPSQRDSPHSRQQSPHQILSQRSLSYISTSSFTTSSTSPSEDSNNDNPDNNDGGERLQVYHSSDQRHFRHPSEFLIGDDGIPEILHTGQDEDFQIQDPSDGDDEWVEENEEEEEGEVALEAPPPLRHHLASAPVSGTEVTPSSAPVFQEENAPIFDDNMGLTEADFAEAERLQQQQQQHFHPQVHRFSPQGQRVQEPSIHPHLDDGDDVRHDGVPVQQDYAEDEVSGQEDHEQESPHLSSDHPLLSPEEEDGEEESSLQLYTHGGAAHEHSGSDGFGEEGSDTPSGLTGYENMSIVLPIQTPEMSAIGATQIVPISTPRYNLNAPKIVGLSHHDGHDEDDGRLHHPTHPQMVQEKGWRRRTQQQQLRDGGRNPQGLRISPPRDEFDDPEDGIEGTLQAEEIPGGPEIRSLMQEAATYQQQQQQRHPFRPAGAAVSAKLDLEASWSLSKQVSSFTVVG